MSEEDCVGCAGTGCYRCDSEIREKVDLEIEDERKGKCRCKCGEEIGTNTQNCSYCKEFAEAVSLGEFRR